MSNAEDLFGSDVPAATTPSRASTDKKTAPEAPGATVKKTNPSPKRAALKSGNFDDPDAYTAADIEVLEGLEPVRKRPGMYIGGTDEKAMHHLFAEVIDNSMDEAIAGHANWIEVTLNADGSLSV
ncbi:MAG: DNA topoisomerase IV subunit B, partial [Rhizobiales bacterium]|nr:DNA topoisomerase IV subunit B [Hyphomicrobiales bacterium]